MRKFMATFKLTYSQKVKSKSFIIVTAILMALIILGSNIDKIFNFFNVGSDQVGVVSPHDSIYQQIKTSGKQIDNDIKFEALKSEDEAMKKVKNKDLDEAYVIHMTKDGKMETTIISRDSVKDDRKAKVQAVMSQLQMQMEAQKLNLSNQELKGLLTPSKIDTKQISDTKDTGNDTEKGFRILFVDAILIIMFFIVYNYATQIAMEIATEKTSRVIEMIITSVSPVIHLLAKVSAIILVALTQLAIVIGTAIACYFIFDLKAKFGKFNIQFTSTMYEVMVYGLLFFVIGIFTYVLLAAILGATTSRIEDVAQSLMPLSLLQFAAFYIAIFSISTPNTTLTKITSFVPFLSPYVMFLRSSSPDTPTWHILIGILISVVTIFVLLYIAVRSYKDSVLTFEKGLIPSFKKIFAKDNNK